MERAGFHWGMAGKLLDQELASVFGAAKPTLRIHDPAATAVHTILEQLKTPPVVVFPAKFGLRATMLAVMAVRFVSAALNV